MRHGCSILAVAAVLLALAPAHAQDVDLARALRGYDATLTPVEDLAVRADFDGDGDLDAAAVVTDGRNRAFLVFESEAGAWRVHPLYALLPDAPVRLRVVQPGPRRVLGAKRTVELTTPGVELVFPGRSSALYVIRDGRWQVHGTENY